MKPEPTTSGVWHGRTAGREPIPGGFAEVGSIDYQGATYSAAGAYVDDARIVCYCQTDPAPGSVVTDWEGGYLGRVVKASSRPAVFFGRRSWHGSRYYSFRVRLGDGREYACRGFGAQMVALGRRVSGL